MELKKNNPKLKVIISLHGIFSIFIFLEVEGVKFILNQPQLFGKHGFLKDGILE